MANIYESDWSSGTDNWTGAGITVTGNNDSIGGENDCFKMEIVSGTSNKRAERSASQLTTDGCADTTATYWSFDIYIPSANPATTSWKFTLSAFTPDGGAAIFGTPTADTWTHYDLYDSSSNLGTYPLRFYMSVGNDTSSVAAGDIIYLKNFTYHQTPVLRSITNFVSGPAVHTFPLPETDATIGQDDRQHLNNLYAGILATDATAGGPKAGPLTHPLYGPLAGPTG